MAGVQRASLQRRQVGSLIEHHRYLISRYAQGCRTALDVGCGRGYVMENLKDLLDMKGMDIDRNEVRNAGMRGLDVVSGSGLELPFDDSSFDIVMCSFYLMWVDDIERALREMVRVSSGKVIILSEPVWSRAFIIPKDMNDIIEASISNIIEEGGCPDSAIEMLRIVRGLGLDHRFGTVPMDTSPKEMVEHTEFWMESVGMERSVTDAPVIFHVPFIWAVIDTS
ncbi:MAG: hypothetical protein DRN57_01420 [Thermoplasmata archaeon]|nr:MAG: hypothetical protein DRN57_01420 [Thermoplasmata archaeon]